MTNMTLVTALMILYYFFVCTCRLEKIPQNPETQSKIIVTCQFVKFPDDEPMIKGNLTISDNERILLMSKNTVLYTSKAKNAGFDCTFCIAPNPNFKPVRTKIFKGRDQWIGLMFILC